MASLFDDLMLRSAGLFGDRDPRADRALAILAGMSQGMGGAQGYRGQPPGLGQMLAGMGGGAMQGLMQARGQERDDRLARLQAGMKLGEYEMAAGQRKAALDALARKTAAARSYADQVRGTDPQLAQAIEADPDIIQKLSEAQIKQRFPEPYTLNPGDVRYGAGNQPIAQGAPRVADGMRVGADGKIELIPEYWNARAKVAAAGKTSIGVNLPPSEPSGKLPEGYFWNREGTGYVPRPIPGLPEEPGGENANRIALARTGAEALSKIPALAKGEDGSMDRKTLLELEGHIRLGTPLVSAKARDLYTRAFTATEARLRLTTGAAAPEEEVRRNLNAYLPGVLDDDKTMANKLGELDSYFGEFLQTQGLGRRGSPTSRRPDDRPPATTGLPPVQGADPKRTDPGPQPNPEATPTAIRNMGLPQLGALDVSKLDEAQRAALDARLKALGY